MNKKRKIIEPWVKAIIALIVIVVVYGGVTFVLKGDGKMMFDGNDAPIDGGRNEYQLEGYPSSVKSKDIIYFDYECGQYHLQMQKEKGKLHVYSTGGYSSQRDGKYFIVDYQCDDDGFIKDLQKLIDKYEIVENNGHVGEVAGLPAGYGDAIDIKYESGEMIYKSDNQQKTISEKAGKKIYDLFRKQARKLGMDFTSEGSNVNLYDDAGFPYLWGTWKGNHFGHEYLVQFDQQRVKIFKDGQLSDDTYISITQGVVASSELKEGIDFPKAPYDYKGFTDIAYFKKSNESTLMMYFIEGGYSSDCLYRQSDN